MNEIDWKSFANRSKEIIETNHLVSIGEIDFNGFIANYGIMSNSNLYLLLYIPKIQEMKNCTLFFTDGVIELSFFFIDNYNIFDHTAFSTIFKTFCKELREYALDVTDKKNKMQKPSVLTISGICLLVKALIDSAADQDIEKIENDINLFELKNSLLFSGHRARHIEMPIDLDLTTCKFLKSVP